MESLNRKNLNKEEDDQMEEAIVLIYEGINKLQNVKRSFWDRTDYEGSTGKLENHIEQFEEGISEFVDDFEKKEDYFGHDFVQAKVVNLLAQDLPCMIESDEVVMTFENIDKVMRNQLKEEDKELINSILNSSETKRWHERIKEYMFKKEYLERVGFE